jgi:hypothetical protein
MLEDWAEATGNKAIYVQMWSDVHDHWAGEDGLLTAKDLGVDTSGMKTVKDAYRMMDWSKLL